MPARHHLSLLLNFFSLLGFCRLLLLNVLNDLEAYSIYQQKARYPYQLQRSSVRFYYINFLVKRRLAGSLRQILAGI